MMFTILGMLVLGGVAGVGMTVLHELSRQRDNRIWR